MFFICSVQPPSFMRKASSRRASGIWSKPDSVTVRISNPGLGEVEDTHDLLAVLGETRVVVGQVVVKQHGRKYLRVETRCNPEHLLEQTPRLR
jgi:hypothetical protein